MGKKIVIIGSGHVGSNVARALAYTEWAGDIVLVDTDMNKAIAQAADVADSLSFSAMESAFYHKQGEDKECFDFSENVVRAGELKEYLDADIVVVSVGMPRKPGQKRLDMLDDSAVMLKKMTEDMKAEALKIYPGLKGKEAFAKAFKGIVITITNPADIVADYVRTSLGMERFRCFGTGTLLDTFRIYRALSESTGVKRSDIEAYVFGEHGDSSTAPKSLIKIKGNPEFDIDDVMKKTHEGGDVIIHGKGSTEFGIGQALAFLAKQVVYDTGIVLPLSVHLMGEYGFDDVNCGVPCRVGKDGISEIIEMPLKENERELLAASIDVIRKHTERAFEIAPIGE